MRAKNKDITEPLKTGQLKAMNDAMRADVENLKKAIDAGARMLDIWEGKVKFCPDCGAPMELVKASDGAMISTPYFPRYPLRGAELPRKERAADFWSCTCDHCEEAQLKAEKRPKEFR